MKDKNLFKIADTSFKAFQVIQFVKNLTPWNLGTSCTVYCKKKKEKGYMLYSETALIKFHENCKTAVNGSSNGYIYEIPKCCINPSKSWF